MSTVLIAVLEIDKKINGQLITSMDKVMEKQIIL